MGSGITYIKRNFEELGAENLVNRVNDLKTDGTIMRTVHNY